MKKSHNRLQLQIFGLSLCFALLIALGATIVNIVYVQNNNRRAIAQSTEYNLQITANSLEQDINEINALADWSSVNTMIRNFILYQPNSKDLGKNYETVFLKYNSMRTSRYLYRYIITDCDTKFIQIGTLTSISRSLDTDTVKEFPGLLQADTSLSWSTIFTDPLVTFNTSPVIPVIQSTSSKNNKNVVVYLAISTTLVTDALKEYTLPEQSELYWGIGDTIYSVSGDIITPIENDFGTPQTEVPANLELQDSNTLFWEAEDGSVILGYPIGTSGMFIAQSISKEVYSGLVFPATSSLFIILIAILALGLLLGFLLRRLVATPVVALQNQLDVISQGDFTPNKDIEWNNELGDIGRGINHLSVSISNFMDERVKDEKQKQELEYRMLQNQINPHFLYNTLNSIKWMATIQQSPGIAEMTTALSRLLKNVSKGNERIVPLQDEFALLNDYFTIQQYRYGGTIGLDVRYIEDESICQNCMIPRFTLQPIVENAIFHGIEPKGCAGKIDITINFDPVTDDVLIALTDDGVGMSQEQINAALTKPPASSEKKYSQIGLFNVHKRLQYIFGEQYGLSIDSVLGKGTTVSIRLPNSSPKKIE